MRVVIDYRSALRERSGVGEYTHQLARALLSLNNGREPSSLHLTLFSSSWKDRFKAPAELARAEAIDRRIPVALLNLGWHRVRWPSIEALTGRPFDVAHSMHPLLLPSRDAAQVVTIHDLNFLTHPERTSAEIRRDYPTLARRHAHAADQVIVVSEFTAGEVMQRFDLARERISVCSPGAPSWEPREGPPDGGYVLFFGTLEPRKNVGGLLDAYAWLASRRRDLPTLVLAGKATEASASWLDRLNRPPLRGVARHIGYVDPSRRRALYEGAIALVQPSFEEGFGIPVLEAMTLGVPVIVSRRGALPEVAGDAGIIVDSVEPEGLGAAIERVLDDRAFAAEASRRGIERARQYSWASTAQHVYEAYGRAIERRRTRAG
jgi:glycosyltransferase involved in cell wall biosynthesis